MSEFLKKRAVKALLVHSIVYSEINPVVATLERAVALGILLGGTFDPATLEKVIVNIERELHL